MELKERAVAALVAQDPRQSADTTLGLLLTGMLADSAALFLIRDQAISLFVGRALNQEDLDRALEAWEDAHVSILAGETYSDDRFALVPLGRDGLLYLGCRRTLVVDHAVLAALEPLLRTAVALAAAGAASVSPVDVYLERTPVPDIERERLVLLLERNEWNIARVARIQKVTRLTIYNQMRRLGIPRRRVVKSPRRDINRAS